MEKSKNYRLFSILSLAVSIVAVSFAYASLTHTLKIKTADGDSMKGESWIVEFENLSNATLKGDATEVTKPTIQEYSTVIAGYDVVFRTPGDSVSYTFDVFNGGTLNASLSAIELVRPTCIGNSTDCRNILKNIKYTLTYADGSKINVGDILYAKKYEIFGERRQKMKIYIEFSKDADPSELPSHNVILRGFDVILIYNSTDVG